MSTHRFRFFATRNEAGHWVIDDADELNHLTKVLRLGVGTEVELTDGCGRASVGHLTAVSKTQARVVALSESFQAAPSAPIVLVLGALKHGAFDEILPSLVELGVDAIHLYLQEGADKTRLSPKAVDRWQRIIAQALKQCKRNHRPTLSAHGSYSALMDALTLDASRQGLVLVPGAAQGLLPALHAAFAKAANSGVTLVVGGEQGLSNDEVEGLLACGFMAVHAGDGILRAVTAALAAVAAAAFARP